MINPKKDSGVEWIGEIPYNWKICKIKYTTKLNGRIGWQGLTSSEYQDEGPYLITGTDFHEGRINFESAVRIKESRWTEAKQIQVENGDLLITKDGTVGKVAIIDALDGKASLNSGVLRIRTIDEVNPKFLYFVLLSEEFWLWFHYTNSGASTILHLYQNVFEKFTYVIPSIQEQEVIINYLDVETEKLDDAKDLLVQQIEKLKEYRESLIWETVTKGLDKTVQMTDSGVDWIGKIPVGWGLKRLKDYVGFQTGGTPKNSIGVNQENDGIKWFKPSDFDVRTIDLDVSENNITNEVVKETKIRTFPKNTVLVVAIASIGKVGISITESYSNQQITALINKGEISSKYLAYVMSAMSDYIKRTALYTVVPIINNQYLSTLIIPFPNIIEQENIIQNLDNKMLLIDGVISTLLSQIEVIDKQRKTLIYDYITGKRRVEL